MKKIVLLIILFPIFCFAEQYYLDELIELGLERSVEMQKEISSYQNSKSSLRSSYMEILPSASIIANKSKIIEKDWNRTSGFSLTKSIYLDEPTYFKISQSLIDKQNSELALQEATKQIVFNIVSLYLSVLESQKSLEIHTENLKLQNKIYSQILAQFESGEKSILDLKQSEIDLIDYEIAVNEAENNLSKLRKDLFSYLNVQDEEHDFAEPEFEEIESELNFQNNLNMIILKNEIKSSKLSLFQTKLNFFPTVYFSYSYNYNNANNEAFFDFDEYDDSQTISLNASYSIFDLLDKRESLSRTARNFKIQKLSFEDTEKNYRNEFSNLQKDVKTLKRSRDLYAEKLELAAENLNMAQEQFKLGMISLIDLDRSQLEYRNTQLSFNNRHYSLMRKQEELNLLLSKKILGKW